MRRLAMLAKLFWWFNGRRFRDNLVRNLAVLIGVGLGAAMFTSVRLAVNASTDAFAESVSAATGRAEASVVATGGRVDERLLASILRVDGVAAAAPVLAVYVSPASGPDPVGQDQLETYFKLVGIDPFLDAAFRERNVLRDVVENGDVYVGLLSEPWTMVATTRLAEELALAPGDVLRVDQRMGSRFLRLLGVLDPTGPARMEGGLTAIADLATVQELIGARGEIDRIDLRFEPGAMDAAWEAIEVMLPAGTELAAAAAGRDSGRIMIRAYDMNLTALSVVSLFVGMFLVYSLVALNAASRRFEIAVLRAVGAGGKTVFGLFVAEGVVLGLLGWLAGMAAAPFVVQALTEGVSRTASTLFTRAALADPAFDAGEILLSLMLTVGVAMLAALQPAREAMAVSPREVLSGPGDRPAPYALVRMLAIGGVLALALVLPVAAIPGPVGFPVFGYVGVFLLFVGCALLTPWLLHMAGRGFEGVWRLGGTAAWLAARSLRQMGPRASISIGALVTATALFTALVIMVGSFRATFGAWINETVSGDLFVTPVMSEINRNRDPLPPEVLGWIEANAGEARTLPYQRIFKTYDGMDYVLEAMNIRDFVHTGGRFLFTAGDADEALNRAARGEAVIVSETFAQRAELGLGDVFRTTIRGEPFAAQVAGVVRSYRTRGGVVFVSLPHLRELTGEFASGVRVFFPTAVDRAERRQLAQEFRDRLLSQAPGAEGIEAISGARLRRAILDVFDETFAVTTTLLGIALVVAALGVATTLSVMVLDRKRQLATLRAVGGSRLQTAVMIIWEGAIMVGVGELVGFLGGLALSWVLIYVINYQSFGWTFVYAVDWAELGLGLPLIFAAALGASWPALRMVFATPPALVLRER
jgi:putative ABC transport system permease protein